MKRYWLAGSAMLVFGSGLALAQPESLLPDIFEDPPEQPAPVPTPTAAAPRPQQTARPAPGGAPSSPATSSPVIQDVPSTSSPAPSPSGPTALPADFPSLAEIEQMEDYEINELFGLRPKFDVPPSARRALVNLGVISRAEGGLPSASLAEQPAPLVRAALENIRGPLVSRWGHILLRRALASRMNAPEGMNPVEFAGLRAAALNRMGEGQIARALVQDIESGEYDRALTDAAFDAYLATGDLLGMCPVAQAQATTRDDGEWILMQAICEAYLGEERGAERRLQRALGTGEAPEIDVRLAQRYAGAAGDGGRAVNIEWDGVEELTPWRYALARALGVELPEELREEAGLQYVLSDALIPAVPITERIEAADTAAALGVLSSSAMVDLYSQLYANDALEVEARVPGQVLREAYVAAEPSARLQAIRTLWGESESYGPRILTAYAAARLPVAEAFQEDAAEIIGSMLTAGLYANAMRWEPLVSEGSRAWGLLALARPSGNVAVSGGALDSYVDEDDSAGLRKSRFLLAGLAGLGRLESDVTQEFAERLGVNLTRSSAWSSKISRAGEYGNAALVALLAGLGMQGDSWDKMTARHLYFIVRALDQAGLEAEARMIAAEAVARG